MMTPLRTALALALATIASPLATAHAQSTARATTSLAGTYNLNSRTSVRVTSPMPRSEERRTTETAIVTQTGSQVHLQVNSSTGDRCELDATRINATTVRFSPGQTCNITDPVRNVPLTLTLQAGTATVARGRLTVQITWGVTGRVFLFSVAGTATQRSTGARTG